MAKHEFGGDWTVEKLERIRKYLSAYTTIFTRNPAARLYRTIYVDAFAGTGHRTARAAKAPGSDMFGDTPDTDREAYKKGSTRIALDVTPPFDRYVFIERKPEHVADLRQLTHTFSDRQGAIQIEQGDANDFLKGWCAATDWSKHRAVVFLDPYGMQVDWTTLLAIAQTQAIDLWLLFPLGVAVNRLLTRHRPPPEEWGRALTRILGTDGWREAFYAKREEATLFGTESLEYRQVGLEEIADFFLKRLRTIFAGVAKNALSLSNSKGQPIYLLCFAAGNKRGARTAVKIAQDILKPQG